MEPIRILVLLVGLLLTPLAAAGVSDWIPFQHRSGHITIPVTLNGEHTTAIFDTGASGNGISESFLQRHEGDYELGRRITVRGVYGQRRVHLVNGIRIGMFGSEFNIGELMPMRIGGFDLLVGLPFFENYIVQIDYPNNRMRLIDHESLDLRKAANVKMRHESSSSHPIVKVNLNGEYEPWLTLDTGNNSSILMSRIDASRLGWLEDYESTDTRGVGINAIVAENERFYLPTIQIGPYTLENVAVTVPRKGQKSNIGWDSHRGVSRQIKRSKSKGLLGYDVLKHFVVTIDLKRSLLHLEPPSQTTAE